MRTQFFTAEHLQETADFNRESVRDDEAAAELDGLDIHGRILSIQAEDPVEFMDFEYWTTTGDLGAEPLDMHSDQAIAIAYSNLAGFAERLNVPHIHPRQIARGFRGSCTYQREFSQWWVDLGWMTALQVVAFNLAEAGYDVYLSDTGFEIYQK